MRSWVNCTSSQRTRPLGYLAISKLLSLARTGVASTVMLSCSIKEDREALSHLAFFSYMPMSTPMHVYTERGIYHIQKKHTHNMYTCMLRIHLFRHIQTDTKCVLLGINAYKYIYIPQITYRSSDRHQNMYTTCRHSQIQLHILTHTDNKTCTHM